MDESVKLPIVSFSAAWKINPERFIEIFLFQVAHKSRSILAVELCEPLKIQHALEQREKDGSVAEVRVHDDVGYLRGIEVALNGFLGGAWLPAANSWELNAIVVEEATQNRQVAEHAIVCAALLLDSLNHQVDEDVTIATFRILLKLQKLTWKLPRPSRQTPKPEQPILEP